MTEPMPGEMPIDGLTFEDAPTPNAEASRGFVADPPPEPDKGGFRGFASRSARNGSRSRRSKKTETPLAVQVAIPNRKGQFVEPLTKMYAAVGTGVIMFDPVCGQAVLMSAQKCAETVDELAYNNEAVRRAVWALCQTSVWGAVIAAHMPIIMAIVMHHVPAAQQAFGAMGANMMEEFLKQTTPETPADE